MPSQTRLAGAGAEVAAYSVPWVDPGNVSADDGAYAAAGPDWDGALTHFLRATNFGFALPDGATVDGIVVEVEASNPQAPAGRTDVARVNIVKGGAGGAQDRSADAPLTLTAADFVYAYGSAAELWGEAWAAADINAADFGAQVAYGLDPNADIVHTSVRVDYVSITVHFTDNTPVEVLLEDGGAAGEAAESLSVVAVLAVADAGGGGGGTEAASVFVVPAEPAEPPRPARADFFGRCLRLPVRSDARGTLAVVASREELVSQSVRSILSTRQGERLMLPDYGIADFAFAVKGVGFAVAVAYFVREQILKYEPLIESAAVRDGTLLPGGGFSPQLAGDEHSAAIEVVVTLRGSNTPLNLVFPLWEYRA